MRKLTPELLKRCPRGFKPELVHSTRLSDIPYLLSRRHPHLTEEQHLTRITFAVHEAAHFIVASLTNDIMLFGPLAYIKVPDQHSKYGNHHNASGAIEISNAYDHKVDMMISFAGIIADIIMIPGYYTEITPTDEYDFIERLENYATESNLTEGEKKAFGHKVVHETLAAVVMNWTYIEWVAAALLIHCDRSGDINDVMAIDDYLYVHHEDLIFTDWREKRSYSIPLNVMSFVESLNGDWSIPHFESR